MAFFHCLLNGSGTSGDGSTWDDDSSGTAAFIGAAGLVSALSGAAAGDTIYVKGTDTTDASASFVGPTTLASFTNPVRVIGVIAATTNLGASVVQSDLVPGLRTGNSTRAYDQTAGNAPPAITPGGTTADVIFSGAVSYYGIVIEFPDNTDIGTTTATAFWAEECKFTAPGAGDHIFFGNTSGSTVEQHFRFSHCNFVLTSATGFFTHSRRVRLAEFFDCKMDLSDSTAAITFSDAEGLLRFYGCDFSGSTATIIDLAGAENVVVEFFNCKFPASHILVAGTAAGEHVVINYGSEDNTGFDSADSEQQLEWRTLQGTVDIETVKVRTGGADDGATDSGGPFSWAINDTNVTDNYVGVESPWMYIWVDGDGTAKTLTVFIANDSASTDLQDDELYLQVLFPSEAGISMFDYLPDEGAPGDGGGRMQLLGTAADLTDDTGSTWGSGANNHQKLTQAIAPDYRGVVQCRVIYSKVSGPELYVDPKPEIT